MVEEYPSTRAEALATGKTRYFTGKTCANGHVAPRSTVNHTCLECSKDIRKRSDKKHPEIKRDRNRAWAAANRDKMALYNKSWWWSHRDEILPKKKRRYESKRHEWLNLSSSRRSAGFKAPIVKAHEKETAAIYKRCSDITNKTGVAHEVDHVVPINGVGVCGLHVPWNLQIVERDVNRSKGNKLYSCYVTNEQTIERYEMSLDAYAGQTLEEAFPDTVDPQFKPWGARILVQMRRPQGKSKGGIVLTAETKSDKAFSEQIGRIHSMGPLAFHNRNTMEPWPEGVSGRPGMFVRLPRYGGDVFYTDPKDGGEPIPWKMVGDHEIFGEVTGDPLAFKVYIL